MTGTELSLFSDISAAGSLFHVGDGTISPA
jgi:hypothetical protein